jgi:hypothetical protein
MRNLSRIVSETPRNDPKPALQKNQKQVGRLGLRPGDLCEYSSEDGSTLRGRPSRLDNGEHFHGNFRAISKK